MTTARTFRTPLRSRFIACAWPLTDSYLHGLRSRALITLLSGQHQTRQVKVACTPEVSQANQLQASMRRGKGIDIAGPTTKVKPFGQRKTPAFLS